MPSFNTRLRLRPTKVAHDQRCTQPKSAHGHQREAPHGAAHHAAAARCGRRKAVRKFGCAQS